MPRAALPFLLLALAGPAHAVAAAPEPSGGATVAPDPAIAARPGTGQPGLAEPAVAPAAPPAVPPAAAQSGGLQAPDAAAPPATADAGAAHAVPPPVLPLPPNTARLAVSGVLGRTVDGPERQDIGRVVDVLVDGSGVPRAAVIDFGGFMGLGSRKIAVEWSAFTFPPSGSDAVLTIALSPEQIKDTPEYAGPGKPVAVVGLGTPVPRPGP